jgi:membrane protein required for colicin V production
MNYFDLILLIIVLCTVLSGFRAGLVRVTIGFVATVLGIICGMWFYYIPAGWVHEYLASSTAANVFGYFVVFLGFVVAGAILARILEAVLKFTGLSFFNRLGGAAFGFVQGALAVIAIITVITAFAPRPLPRVIVESKVMPYAATAGSVLASTAPQSVTDAYHDSIARLRRLWSENQSAANRKGAAI